MRKVRRTSLSNLIKWIVPIWWIYHKDLEGIKHLWEKMKAECRVKWGLITQTQVPLIEMLFVESSIRASIAQALSNVESTASSYFSISRGASGRETIWKLRGICHEELRKLYQSYSHIKHNTNRIWKAKRNNIIMGKKKTFHPHWRSFASYSFKQFSHWHSRLKRRKVLSRYSAVRMNKEVKLQRKMFQRDFCVPTVLSTIRHSEKSREWKRRKKKMKKSELDPVEPLARLFVRLRGITTERLWCNGQHRISRQTASSWVTKLDFQVTASFFDHQRFSYHVELSAKVTGED